MISVYEVLNNLTKEENKEIELFEKKVDQELLNYDNNPIFINCYLTERAKSKIIEKYSKGGWIVSSFCDQRDGSGLKFEIPRNRR